MVHGNTGRKRTFTPEWIEKMRQTHQTPEYKERQRQARSTPEAIERNRQTHLGKKHSPETIKKISQARIGRQCGKDNPNWQGGISFEPYCIKWTNKLREDIRNKYERKCFICGKSEAENNGRRLSVHHVDYDKEQGCNGKTFELVPLCRSCHSKTGSNRDEYEKILRIKLEISCIIR